MMMGEWVLTCNSTPWGFGNGTPQMIVLNRQKSSACQFQKKICSSLAGYVLESLIRRGYHSIVTAYGVRPTPPRIINIVSSDATWLTDSVKPQEHESHAKHVWHLQLLLSTQSTPPLLSPQLFPHSLLLIIYRFRSTKMSNLNLTAGSGSAISQTLTWTSGLVQVQTGFLRFGNQTMASLALLDYPWMPHIFHIKRSCFWWLFVQL